MILCLVYISYLKKIQGDEMIERFMQLSNLLETAKFKEFWLKIKSWENVGKAVHSIPGFDDAIRGFILGILTRTSVTIKKQFLSEVLNLDATNLDAFITARDWKQTDQTVTFPQESQAKPVRVVEHIRFDQLTKILQSLQ